MVAGKIILPRRAKRRTVFDARNTTALPGRLVRAEGQARVRDRAANEAYDGAGQTYDYFQQVHERASVDDRGAALDSTVHYGVDFVNAQWNGRQMMYGDGDGKYFNRFTACLEVIAHELAHGVSQYTAAFDYSGQSGALSEHFSDVFGVLVKQHAKKQTAARADWLIGKGLFT
ncbi:MAG TPA: M4 family metallopeptidase, partial [Thermoanaerobaculia bacterium]|nr:M4 family metallopeptidase [Thermoanaerobaculia bacterium]